MEEVHNQGRSLVKKIIYFYKGCVSRTKSFFNWWTETKLLVLFNASLAVFTILLWLVAQNSLTEVRKGNIASQRAFVYFDKAVFQTIDKKMPPETKGGLTLFNLPISVGKAISITFALANSGNTPTRSLQYVIDCHRVGLAERPQDPFSLFKWDDNKAVRQVIGPKQTIEFGPCELTPENVLDAQMGVVPIYFMGEVRYQDIVDPDTPHVTQFSQELVVRDFDFGTANLDAVTRGVGQHNCTDEDCPK